MYIISSLSRGGTSALFQLNFFLPPCVACVPRLWRSLTRETHMSKGAAYNLFILSAAMGLCGEGTGAALAHLFDVVYMYTYITLDGCMSV